MSVHGGWAAVRAAASDRTSGASEVARAAAEALASLPRQDLEGAVTVLVRGQPTMAPVWRLGTEAMWAFDHRWGVRRFLELLERDREAAAVLARALPERLASISRSSLVAEAIRLRRPALLVCLESEPGGEGRLAAADLRGAAGSIRVVPDEEALRTLSADAVVVGADAVTPEAVVNKVGTRALAEAAAARGIPCYAVAGETKLVADRLPVAPAFESVPLGLIAAVATPGGLLPPAEARRLAMRRPIHPDLKVHLEGLGGAVALPFVPGRSRPGPEG